MAEFLFDHPHLPLEREEPVTERRSHGGGSRPMVPGDPRGHGAALRRRLQSVREGAGADLGGYDDRRLIKLTLATKVPPDEMAKIANGVELVSQEGDTLVLVFATEDQLDEFEAKLASLEGGGPVTRVDLLYALDGVDRWTEQDRTGWALRRDGFPDTEPFLIDAEVWPLARDAAVARTVFERWVAERDGEVIDAVRKPYLTIYRIRCDRTLADALLRNRDVRSVDLPPRFGLDVTLIRAAVQELDEVPGPPNDSPGVVVLDSGVVTGHPVLAPAVGDAQSFLPGFSAADEHGHGTLVSGIALYGDVAECLRSRRFVPQLRLFSGRVLDQHNEGDARFMENRVEQAVRYFVDNYGCRVFNLSYGDRNKPYRGGRVAGLAVTLDALSRELDVIFVVPTGNYVGSDGDPDDWLADYPAYLSGDDTRLLDPAPALSALTVGSLARMERSTQAVRYPDDPSYRPVAQADQPSPFTRRGPSVNGAIKPDLVDYGGNLAVDARTDRGPMVGQSGVGELSTSREFASGLPFAEESGTSFAAPRVAHMATCILSELPDTGANLCRALLVAHARTPAACADLFADDEDVLRAITGYGLVDRSALYRSVENCVTLCAEESIANRRHHFFEVPITEGFWTPGLRPREVSVALAYCPPTRTTRIDYRAVRMGFKLVQADSLNAVARSFNASVERDTVDVIKEVSPSSRRVSEQTRSRGTAQASVWTFKRPDAARREQRWFIVVTRNDPSWGENLSAEQEKYALVVVISDRESYRGQLYGQIQERLRERIRVRMGR